MPLPSSSTAISTRSPARCADTSMRLVADENLTALSSRRASTWPSREGSVRQSGKPSSTSTRTSDLGCGLAAAARRRIESTWVALSSTASARLALLVEEQRVLYGGRHDRQHREDASLHLDRERVDPQGVDLDDADRLAVDDQRCGEVAADAGS